MLIRTSRCSIFFVALFVGVRRWMLAPLTNTDSENTNGLQVASPRHGYDGIRSDGHRMTVIFYWHACQEGHTQRE